MKNWFNNLEELMNLFKKYGKLIISDTYDFKNYSDAGCKQKIVIYDDWIE